jgi:hypothetical protein
MTKLKVVKGSWGASTILSAGLSYIWVFVMHAVVKMLNVRQDKALYKVILHRAKQMAADRNILKMKQNTF